VQDSDQPSTNIWLCSNNEKTSLTMTGPMTTLKMAPVDALDRFWDERKKIWPSFNTPFGSNRESSQLRCTESRRNITGNDIRLYRF
jgi:hypothetical protein